MNPETEIEEKKSIDEDAQISNAEDNYKKLENCPYCYGKVIKKGKRKKKYEEVQVYYCTKCNKKITSLLTKYKTYPLKVIIDSLTLFNRLHSLGEVAEKIKEKYGISLAPRTIKNWSNEYKNYTPFSRMREFVLKKYSQKEMIEEVKLIHKQIYNFKYHRAKLDIILNEEFRHQKFKPLREFLELAVAECPHQIFQNPSKRASEFKETFNLDQVKIVPRENRAIQIASFIMQAVSNNKQRHESLQEFMLSNDSVTVATEVAVLLDSDDIRHLKHELKFEVPIILEENKYITGHIDILQVRNGLIYIMDFKPSASKEKPIEQLALYALALSRLTGIRLYHMMCAWFDDKNYYEFFPLHIFYKLKKRKKKDTSKIRVDGNARVSDG